MGFTEAVPSTDRACTGAVSGLALRRIRLGIGVTQQDLADHLGVDPNTVKGWETARRPLGHAKAGDVQGIRFGLRDC